VNRGLPQGGLDRTGASEPRGLEPFPTLWFRRGRSTPLAVSRTFPVNSEGLGRGRRSSLLFGSSLAGARPG
jgi:hypothetical protein